MPGHTVGFTVESSPRLILAGAKDQTLRRAETHGHIRVGDTLHLRQWIGKPRQKGSRQEYIATVTVREVERFMFRLDLPNTPVYTRPYADLALKGLTAGQKARLAERDGFKTFEDLAEVLRGFYGEVALEMVALRWDAPKADAQGMR